MDPRYDFNSQPDPDEARRRAEAKAKRRKKRQRDRLILLGAMALAAILLVVGIVAFFRAIFGKKDDASSSVPSSTTSMVSSEPEPVYTYPVAPDTTLWNLQLVNAQKTIDATYQMTNDQLTSVTSVGHVVDSRIAEPLLQMIEDCNAQVEGGSLMIVSGYRSPTSQNNRNQHTIEVLMGQGRSQAEAEILAKQIEPPSGSSEHQIGLAVDFSNNVLGQEPNNENFAQTQEYQWLTQNAANYGFILRYPSEWEAITGITAQSYHWRYVGVDEAHAITGAGICLEQYLMAVPEGTEGTEG